MFYAHFRFASGNHPYFKNDKKYKTNENDTSILARTFVYPIASSIAHVLGIRLRIVTSVTATIMLLFLIAGTFLMAVANKMGSSPFDVAFFLGIRAAAFVVAKSIFGVAKSIFDFARPFLGRILYGVLLLSGVWGAFTWIWTPVRALAPVICAFLDRMTPFR